MRAGALPRKYFKFGQSLTRFCSLVSGQFSWKPTNQHILPIHLSRGNSRKIHLEFQPPKKFTVFTPHWSACRWAHAAAQWNATLKPLERKLNEIQNSSVKTKRKVGKGFGLRKKKTKLRFHWLWLSRDFLFMSVWWGLLFLNVLRNVTNVHDYIVFLFVIPFVSETEGRFWKSCVLPQWWEGRGVSFLIFITRENTRLRLWIFQLFAIPDFYDVV